ncbi:MAG: DUF3108 domain-containing protein [Bacteroidetes bacterium]|nr:DUF3108 domain-containing protein [Bacteroidota bacterium]
MKLFLPLISALMAGSPLLKEIPQQTAAGTDTLFHIRENDAWTKGETLYYRVHYGLLDAGEIEMSVEDELKTINNRAVFHVHAKGRSYSGFDWFYKVRDHYQTYIDTASCQPIQFSKIMEEGSYKDSDFAIFDYKKKKVNSARKGSVAFSGEVQDIISSIYYARTLNVKDAKKGDVFPLQVYLDGEVHDLQIKFVKREVIKTDLGKINAVKVIPMVIADRVFKDQEGLELWVSDDENKVPLRVKAGLLVGSVKVDIMSASNLKYSLNKAD